MAITPSSKPFYSGLADPNHPDFRNSIIGKSMAQNNRRDYYGNWLGQNGSLGTDNKSQFARSQFDNFDQGYAAEQFNKPNLQWTDYLSNKFGVIDQEWGNQSPDEKGINPSRSTGRASWLQRG